VQAALSSAVAGRSGERLRVRLLLAEDGSVTVTVAEQPVQAPGSVMRYVISDTRLDSTNAFLFHKTTRRELYDREWQHYAEALKADEVLYLNERGELAEGSRTNVFVERGGKLLTPPLSSGLLPGVLRRELLLNGKAEEAVLTVEDLARADGVYVGNSVRGLVKAEPLRPLP
jgi:para-aminobenzoate synthetase/4-amino-4-deoxychorismate lyase